ncbi:MAG TPA: hypothetical protein VG204_14460 [Terriglobia bacterium]|nr:hypothetical protein [Terriglobia bacterium]
MNRRRRFATAVALALTILIAASLRAQHEHMATMQHAAPAKLTVANDAAAHVLTVRVGPLNLPARAGMNVAQAPDLMLTIPFDGWIFAYHPRLTDGAGQTLPPRLLHHVAFYNTQRTDLLCPGKPEHIFGAGGEMNDWPATPGVGYRVQKGDQIRVATMVHNESDTSYPRTYLEVKMEYQPLAAGGEELKNVYPVWFDVKECGNSAYDLTPGHNATTGQFTLAYAGKLMGVGGHMHDYGEQLRLADMTRNESIATLDAKLDPQGHIVSMPIVRFDNRNGWRLPKGEVIRVTATYNNPTGHALPDGAMGIAVGYFLPSDESEMAALRRASQPASAAHH